MATKPIRIREDDKDQIDRLQHDFAAATGARPSQQDLMARILDFVRRHKHEFLSEAAWRPWTPEEFARLKSLCGNYGDLSSNIDEVVYGDSG